MTGVEELDMAIAEDTEALTMEDLQIREEFAKERQKTAVEVKI